MAKNGNGRGLLSNPYVIGAATGAILWYVFDEILDDPIERLLGKKKNRNKRRGRGGQKGKLVRNHMGVIVPMDEFDTIGVYETDVDMYDDY